LASRGTINIGLLAAMLVGLGLVVGGGAVFNNYVDRDIDAKMQRTKGRAIVTGAVSPRAALIYGSVLAFLGFAILCLHTNLLASGVALVGIVSYTLLYTPLKRRTAASPLVGSIAGAVPPLVGFCAVSGVLNTEALILFLIFFFWQMPHFYGIAIYKRDDYAAAGVPVLPITKGIRAAKIRLVLYIAGFIVAASLLTLFGFTGQVYLAVMLIVGCVWLWLGIQGFQAGTDDTAWARKMFLFSIAVITVFSLIIAFNSLL
jgi:protoheme IX farnesyltransferase